MKHIDTVDPTTEWYRGPFAFLMRWRWLGSLIGGKLLAALLAFIAHYWILAVIFVALAIVAAVAVLIIKSWRLQQIYSHDCLHWVCHCTRDDLENILRSQSVPEFDRKFDNFHSHAVERIADFFRKLIRDESINCAIRLAEERDGKESYVTRARSAGMDPERAKESTAIPADKGLANALRQKNATGAYIIPSIQQAVDAGMWMEMANDRRPDVKTLMVAPINGWVGGIKCMVGIVYVTSRNNPFMPMHTLPLKALADLLGLAYPLLIRHGKQLN